MTLVATLLGIAGGLTAAGIGFLFGWDAGYKQARRDMRRSV